MNNLLSIFTCVLCLFAFTATAQFQLDVQGNARVTGTTIVDTLFSNRVGIGVNSIQYPLHVRSNSPSNSSFAFTMKAENIGSGTGAAFSSGGQLSGYPSTPAAVFASGYGDASYGVFATSRGRYAGVLAQSQGAGPALEAWAYGNGLAGLFRAGDVQMTDNLHVSKNVNISDNANVTDDVNVGKDVNVSGRVWGNSYRSSGDIELMFDANDNNSLFGFFEIFNGKGNHVFYVNEAGNARIYGNGYVDGKLAVGTTYVPSGYAMSVDGKAAVEEVMVELSQDWPDYVFQDNYNLLQLDELEKSIQQNGHLPGIPSAKEVEEKGGIEVGEMQRKLVEKVEELTLYVIQLKKENDELRAMIIADKAEK